CCRASSCARQASQPLPQKEMTTTWPTCSDRRTLGPARARRAKSGAGTPGTAWNGAASAGRLQQMASAAVSARISDDRRKGGDRRLSARGPQPLLREECAELSCEAAVQRQVIEDHRLDELHDRVGRGARGAHDGAIGAEVADLLARRAIERLWPPARAVHQEEGRRHRGGVALPGELVAAGGG